MQKPARSSELKYRNLVCRTELCHIYAQGIQPEKEMLENTITNLKYYIGPQYKTKKGH